MNNYTYSIIIPHHNTPDLLTRLLNSIPQRDDIEIIVVDDNSDQDKKPIINRNDVQLFYIDKENSRGAGRARNYGLRLAKGKWLLFADADDFYSDGFITILDEYKDSIFEILYFNCISVFSDNLEPQERAMPIHELNLKCDGTHDDAVFRMRFKVQVPWIKMLKSSFVKKYGFQYEEINNGNDIQFSYLSSYFCEKYHIDHRVVYVCTYNRESITFKKRDEIFYKCSLENLYKKNGFREYINKNEWKDNVLALYLSSLRNSGIITFLKLCFYHLSHYRFLLNMKHKYIKAIEDIKKQRM